jgi:hypothetical protein
MYYNFNKEEGEIFISRHVSALVSVLTAEEMSRWRCDMKCEVEVIIVSNGWYAKLEKESFHQESNADDLLLLLYTSSDNERQTARTHNWSWESEKKRMRWKKHDLSYGGSHPNITNQPLRAVCILLIRNRQRERRNSLHSTTLSPHQSLMPKDRHTVHILITSSDGWSGLVLFSLLLPILLFLVTLWEDGRVHRVWLTRTFAPCITMVASTLHTRAPITAERINSGIRYRSKSKRTI